MEKIVYLVRHSEPMKNRNNVINSDSLQVWNEKNPLSINGEKKAEDFASNPEFLNIDYLVSSKYVRAISTAKYFADKNKLDINIDENFGERKHGVESWSDLPDGFEQRQLIDKEYKVGNGENQIEVASRMHSSLLNILNNTDYRKIVIVSHATAITFLLMKMCDYSDGILTFNGEVIMDNNFSWGAPDGFKLVFDDENLIKINNI